MTLLPPDMSPLMMRDPASHYGQAAYRQQPPDRFARDVMANVPHGATASKEYEVLLKQTSTEFSKIFNELEAHRFNTEEKIMRLTEEVKSLHFDSDDTLGKEAGDLLSWLKEQAQSAAPEAMTRERFHKLYGVVNELLKFNQEKLDEAVGLLQDRINAVERNNIHWGSRLAAIDVTISNLKDDIDTQISLIRTELQAHKTESNAHKVSKFKK